MLNISECSENCNACCVFKISVHVENCNACSKLCWILQGMLKTIICVKLCWNSMLKISACIENCYACRKLCQNFKVCWKCLCEVCWKPCRKPCWSMKKTPSHFTARVEIEQQISFFSFSFARVSEVRHMHGRIQDFSLKGEAAGEKRLRNVTFTYSKRQKQCFTKVHRHKVKKNWQRSSRPLRYIDPPLPDLSDKSINRTYWY